METEKRHMIRRESLHFVKIINTSFGVKQTKIHIFFFVGRMIIILQLTRIKFKGVSFLWSYFLWITI